MRVTPWVLTLAPGAVLLGLAVGFATRLGAVQPPPVPPPAPAIVADGKADDTAAFQAAADAALAAGTDVVLPAGTLRITRPVVVGATRPDQLWHGTGLRGAGFMRTRVRWEGSKGAGPALRLSGQEGAACGGFTVLNASGDPDAVGLSLSVPWDAAGGTTSTGVTLRNVLVDGFGVGLEVGGAKSAASEVSGFNLYAMRCKTGVRLSGYNTLNVAFHGLHSNGCGVGLDGGECSAWQVFGGSAGNNGRDFFGSTGGAASVQGVRSEGARRFVYYEASAPVSLALRDCVVQSLAPGETFAVEVGGQGRFLFDGGTYRGRIGVTRAGPNGCDLMLRGVAAVGPGAYAGSRGYPLTGVRTRVEGQWLLGASGQPIGVLPDGAATLP